MNWWEIKGSIARFNTLRGLVSMTTSLWRLMLVQSVNSPQSLQSTVWTLQSSRQTLHWWIRQIVSTQVQMCQMRVGLQSWGQNFTVSLWESTVRKSVMTQILQHMLSWKRTLYIYFMHLMIKQFDIHYFDEHLIFTSVVQIIFLIFDIFDFWGILFL